ncbi:MAG: response regulator [Flavobacterium sp.]|nr:MAG: response regulator [Flavobacterium sp.]
MSQVQKKDAKYLLVNDDRFICLVVGQQIRKYKPNISVSIKANGKKAMEYIEQVFEVGSDTIPNIILLDMQMPIMDGAAFLKTFSRYKTIVETTHLYILTSSADSYVRDVASQYDFVKDVFELPLIQEQIEQIHDNLYKERM